jgi:putative transposase
MARLPRLAVAGRLHLVIQRGQPASPVFLDDVDRQRYLDVLVDSARSNAVAIHAFVLLDGEIRLLVTPRDGDGLGRLMQRVGRRYVPAFNQRHATTGTLWTGRFESAVLDPERYLLPAIRFVETAPVRAGVVAQARDWPWSSARRHVGAGAAPWLAEHPLYWRLGNTPFEREARHERLLEEGLAEGEVVEIEDAARRGWVLGSDSFVAEISALAVRPVRPRPRGRPRRPASE